jgi:polyisoprenoid-binding protein YceI
MKNPLIILAVLVAIAVGGWYVFTQTSVVPEDVQRAGITEGDTTVDSTSTTTEASVSVDQADTTVVSEAGKEYAVQGLNFSFVGYGPAGKTETGTFKNITTSNIKVDANGNLVSGKVTLAANSVSTGIEKLDQHLCSDDFFNCSTNPNIVFDFKKAEFSPNGTDVNVTGTLSLNGNTKDVTFKVTRKDSNVSADFLLDTTPFKLKYTGVNKEVRVKFGFSVVERATE